MKFHHIGIFVADLETGRRRLSDLLPIADILPEIEDPGLKVRVQFCVDSAGICYEIVAPFGEGNPVQGILNSGKAILNHVAYQVPDILAEAERQRALGSIPLGPPAPAVAFGGKKVIFLLTPLRFIIELIEG